jgi:fatty acid desaturase
MAPTDIDKASIWRETNGAIPNTLALCYATLGHGAGLALLVQQHWAAFIAGVLLSGHSLVIAAYLIHEAAHMTLFKSRSVNTKVGELLLWIVGAGYASFDRIRQMHLRHHQDRADVTCFDYQRFLQGQPRWVQKLVIGMEWAYLPAIELIMHAQVMIRPFVREHLKVYRLRVILVGLSRLALFVLLFSFSPWALAGYAVAYWIMLQALFLADAFAHTYETFLVERADEPVPSGGRDGAYDVEHTYSNLISPRWPWLNLLNLNFGYHTAHHEKPSVAWHDLPQFHRQLYGSGDHQQVLPYAELLGTIHRNRVRRVFVEDYGEVAEGPNRATSFIGAHGVSFLSIV